MIHYRGILKKGTEKKMQKLQPYDKRFYKKTVAIALPVALQALLNNFLNVIDTVMIGSLGEASLAAVGLANKVFFVLSLVLFGVRLTGAQLAGIAAARPGVSGADIHKAAADVIAAAGYGAYFGHGFGHGVGLYIHEAPNAAPSNTQPMPEGAVISAEPGIYLPGRFGVRIEDVLYLTGEGNVDITKAPKELIILG